ncbi:hypothetical protein TTHERM_001008731 (macronuclear) [Tetrahymena thermophila SB210]|uniref:Uncharacterized protein n=1 Tax=Tetrahymena thermophila (strain SB210) TaxID=312017 RepID=W7X4E6_TETTS|nr:hypothetical protein TTHERM_001008731 [Tetrahymena thermophila SB210]EWS71283.1 hypothetical protein TTHERM_001008731 [Tetrahymena thermophila SB210]|eukprot:XP_012656189.1 hypothetical protein TTHERM_001008731 [Tetrahymena thermophila SB210]
MIQEMHIQVLANLHKKKVTSNQTWLLQMVSLEQLLSLHFHQKQQSFLNMIKLQEKLFHITLFSIAQNQLFNLFTAVNQVNNIINSKILIFVRDAITHFTIPILDKPVQNALTMVEFVMVG